MNDESPDLRNAAVRTLSDWPYESALGPLKKTVESAKEVRHRVLAMRGYLRLLGQHSKTRTQEQTIEAYAWAMKTTERPDERKLVLSGLSNIRKPEALNMVLTAIENKELRTEAEAA